MEIVDIYTTTRASLIELASTVDPNVPVKATPGWTVRDLYAHLAGVAADLVNQNLDGAGTDAWTARQVAERKDASVTEICAEWSANAAIDEMIRQAGNAMSFMGNDVWSHEQDILGVTMGNGIRDGRAAALIAVGLDYIDNRVTEAGVPAVRLRTSTVDRTLGQGAAAATLDTDDYELLRMIFGRRTEAQIRAASWSGDPSASLEALHVFAYPVVAFTD